jgi:hypothetical protein
MFQFFTPKKCLISNMGLYNFVCGPRSYDAFPKWPARSFGLATPGLDNVGSSASHSPVGLRCRFRSLYPSVNIFHFCSPADATKFSLNRSVAQYYAPLGPTHPALA